MQVLKSFRHTVRATLNKLGVDLHIMELGERNQTRWLSNLGIQTVFDVGAHDGEFAQQAHALFPSATIYSFEPLADCFRTLSRLLQTIPQAQAFNVALGIEAGVVEMHRSTFSPSSSLLDLGDLHREAFPFAQEEAVERVTVKRLDDVAADLHLQDPILVKIDVQGFEDNVIKGAPALLNRAAVVLVETSFEPLYVGQPLFADIHSLLGLHGLHYAGAFGQLRHPADGRILQADSIFLRSRSSRPAKQGSNL